MLKSDKKKNEVGELGVHSDDQSNRRQELQDQLPVESRYRYN